MPVVWMVTTKTRGIRTLMRAMAVARTAQANRELAPRALPRPRLPLLHQAKGRKSTVCGVYRLSTRRC